MFTGLIAEMGKVKALHKVKNSYQLTIGTNKIATRLKIGDSIAVNGACLTVIALQGADFTADVMPETAKMTTVGLLQAGELVNLEGTLRLQDGLDGHLVSGHVEGVGKIKQKVADGNAVLVTISCAAALLKYILSKGSIAIDGISLTVTQVTDKGFTVSLIPHTAAQTTLGSKGVGQKVNLETDTIGKYVEQMLKFQDKTATKRQELSKNTLFENGFL
ncbi:MAG: riboflavin synthase [Acidaminococcaceae bacterium]